MALFGVVEKCVAFGGWSIGTGRQRRGHTHTLPHVSTGRVFLVVVALKQRGLMAVFWHMPTSRNPFHVLTRSFGAQCGEPHRRMFIAVRACFVARCSADKERMAPARTSLGCVDFVFAHFDCAASWRVYGTGETVTVRV